MCTVSTTGLNEAWLPFIGEERNVPRDRKYNSNASRRGFRGSSVARQLKLRVLHQPGWQK